MFKRIITYAAIGAGLLAGACSKSSTGTNGGGSGGNTPSDSKATITASAPDSLTNGYAYQVTVSKVSDADGLSKVSIDADRGGQADTTITFDGLSGTSWNKTVSIAYRRPRSKLPEDFTATVHVTDSDGNTYHSDNLSTHVSPKPVPQATYAVTGSVANANSSGPVDGATVQISRNGHPVASGQTGSQGQFSIGVSQDQDSTRSYALGLQMTGYQAFSKDITISGADTDVGALSLPPQDVLFSGTLGLSVKQGDSVFVNNTDLESIVDFQDATKDTIYVTTTDANLDVRKTTNGFWLVPAQGYSGSANYTEHAKSSTAGTGQQTETLTVKRIPQGNFTIINNVTDQPVPGYILVESNQTGAVIDSAAAMDGHVSINLHSPDST